MELADAKILSDAEEAQKLQEAQEKVKQFEKELAELQKLAANPGNETMVKFKVQFEGLGAGPKLLKGMR